MFISFLTKLRPPCYIDAEQNALCDTSTQFDEQRDQVAVEQILRVIFVDPERPSPVSRIGNIFESLICHVLPLILCLCVCIVNAIHRKIFLNV